ncbi:MAG: nucleotide exchange factor GrpE [Betaproteobacteria bacterium]|nr:nucleotide exchange factor GrpE [Betaproteobacteria bacterium]
MSEPIPQPETTTEPAAPAKTLEELLAEAEAKVQEQRDAWLRALADAENARKRAQTDIASAHKYGVERLAEALVPVMDSLQAALADQASDVATLRSGVELTLKQLGAAFEKASLAEINPAARDKFDPHFHQAMMAVEADADPNTVVAVMQKGYRLHDRVIRPALVTVAKARSN